MGQIAGVMLEMVFYIVLWTVVGLLWITMVAVILGVYLAFVAFSVFLGVFFQFMGSAARNR